MLLLLLLLLLLAWCCCYVFRSNARSGVNNYSENNNLCLSLSLGSSSWMKFRINTFVVSPLHAPVTQREFSFLLFFRWMQRVLSQLISKNERKKRFKFNGTSWWFYWEHRGVMVVRDEKIFIYEWMKMCVKIWMKFLFLFLTAFSTSKFKILKFVKIHVEINTSHNSMNDFNFCCFSWEVKEEK